MSMCHWTVFFRLGKSCFKDCQIIQLLFAHTHTYSNDARNRSWCSTNSSSVRTCCWMFEITDGKFRFFKCKCGNFSLCSSFQWWRQRKGEKAYSSKITVLRVNETQIYIFISITRTQWNWQQSMVWCTFHVWMLRDWANERARWIEIAWRPYSFGIDDVRENNIVLTETGFEFPVGGCWSLCTIARIVLFSPCSLTHNSFTLGRWS